MGHSALIWFITLGTCQIFTSADPSKGCTHYAGLGQRYELPLSLAKDKRLRWIFDNKNIYDSKTKTDTYTVTEGGALILPNVAQSNEGSYTAEVLNSDGKSQKETLVLCVQESVSKPTVKFECQAKLKRVRFSCSVPQTKDITYQWLDGGKVIAHEKANVLVRTSNQLGSNSFTCKVSNRATSQTSDPVQSSPDCIKYIPSVPTTGSTTPDEDEKWLGLDFWLMVGILAGGGGLVLVLIVATIVCCSLNRRKRRMRVKDEQELRLQWNTTNHQHHHYSNQRGHGHSHGPAHPAEPSPGQATAKQGPAAAGHTGPRPPKARQNRPRPPDPITGQPLPGPRRLPETGQTKVPSIGNDEENPPPLPQPRKKGGPRTQKR
ncbi:hypothetical protein NQD34_001183 [Periophthalmus magnuspinnatus]|nr:hypothetical protein NQD34_001183 [Periophthalmus magnuspinnatus]